MLNNLENVANIVCSTHNSLLIEKPIHLQACMHFLLPRRRELNHLRSSSGKLLDLPSGFNMLGSRSPRLNYSGVYTGGIVYPIIYP